MVETMSVKERMWRSIAPFIGFFQETYGPLAAEPGMADFTAGNPQELVLPGFVDALRTHVTPLDKDWYAYKLSEPASQRTVAGSLTRRTGIDWDPNDVAITNSDFSALAVTFRAILEPGDEVVFLSPPWFFYEVLILAAGGEPVRVRLGPPGFDLDADAIARAITPRTRAVLVNTPHNPTGRVYELDRLRDLADVLAQASTAAGRTIYLISDEPYNRIVYDGRAFNSPAEAYDATIVTYSYGKTLLAPGMRLGYVTWPPSMPDREALRSMLLLAQVMNGYAFGDALMQHAIADIEPLSIDIGRLERRRDRLVPALRDLGYEASLPEGAFYVMARSPIDDDVAFSQALARHRVLVLPGSVVELPGWFRISLTASDEMVERGLVGFAATRDEVLAAV
jgi:aspartate aminotransferase